MFEGAIKGAVRAALLGVGAFSVAAYYMANFQDKNYRLDLINFYEYRRRLLHCAREHVDDVINCAEHFIAACEKSKKEGKNTAHNANFSYQSYTHRSAVYCFLADLNLDGGVFTTFAMIGMVPGFFLYKKPFQKCVKTCPADKMMVVYWRHAKFTFLQMHKLHIRNFYIALPETESFVWPIFQSTNFIVMKDIPVIVEATFPCLSGELVKIRTKLFVGINQHESKYKPYYNALRIMGLEKGEVSNRACELLQFSLRQIVAQTPSNHIYEYYDDFYTMLQQRIGQTMLELGLRVFRCEYLGYEFTATDDEKSFTYIGGNITNHYEPAYKDYTDFILFGTWNGIKRALKPFGYRVSAKI